MITAIGFIIDYFIGDPQFLYHPVCAIGKLISFIELKIVNFIENRKNSFKNYENALLFGGFVLWLLVCSISYIVTLLILKVLGRFAIIAEIIMCWQIFAARSLKKESMNVKHVIENYGLEAGREAVGRIVGRDTYNLNEKQVIKAAVETVAENTTDGVTAPMIYMFLGGAPLAFFYKAVNTLDSMVGYKNDKYLYLGRFSALADDVFNFIPSRITAVVMIAASYLCGFNAKNACKIFKRDRLKHKSPNSAQTESVCAGALEIELGGDSYYFGKLYKKDTIGDYIRDIETDDISRANKLMYATSAMLLAIILGGKIIICLNL